MDFSAGLQQIVRNGPFNDIFLALQAQHLARALEEHSEAINKSTFQPAFGLYKKHAVDSFILAVTRLLERQSGKNRLQSVHSTLCFLKDHAAQISVGQPRLIEQSMQRLGLWSEQLRILPAEPQTIAIVELLLERLPHHSDNEALKALRTMRDKWIAHPERVNVDSAPSTTWEKALALLKIPIESLAVLGAFVSDCYVDSKGRLLIDGDAQTAAFATRRMLLQLGIISSLRTSSTPA